MLCTFVPCLPSAWNVERRWRWWWVCGMHRNVIKASFRKDPRGIRQNTNTVHYARVLPSFPPAIWPSASCLTWGFYYPLDYSPNILIHDPLQYSLLSSSHSLNHWLPYVCLLVFFFLLHLPNFTAVVFTFLLLSYIVKFLKEEMGLIHSASYSVWLSWLEM